MKNRFLFVVFSFLAVVSSYAGIGAQKAVFSSASDELKIVEIHSTKDFISASFDESRLSGIAERTLSRSQKKTDTQSSLNGCFILDTAVVPSANLAFLSSIFQDSFRVLLLPKSIKNIIFLQTFI